MKPKRLAISMGDPRGIGPEITLKALAVQLKVEDSWDYTIYGSLFLLKELNEKLAIGCPLNRVTVEDTSRNLDCSPALNAISWIEAAAFTCLSGKATAMVTAPISKEETIRAGYNNFTGQTEFLAECSKTSHQVMMLLGKGPKGEWLRIALATTHLPLSQVASSLSIFKIENSIRLASDACKQLKLERYRIGVSGFNPHCGEGGKMGNEEALFIEPAIHNCLRDGLDVLGPISADVLLKKAWQGELDAVVSMYHDQALPALKMVAFDSGVNWTLGLPFTRVSPDHGTAFDIAGKGIASPCSMLAAIALAKKLNSE